MMINLVQKSTHIEVYKDGVFLFSADTYSEAKKELKEVQFKTKINYGNLGGKIYGSENLGTTVRSMG